MTSHLRWIVPSLLAIGLAWTPSRAAEIRDSARMFSPEAVAKVQDELTRLERETGIPITIETVESLPGVAADAPREAKLRAVNQLAVSRDRELRAEGIYLLLSKNDRVISNVLTRERYAAILTKEKRLKIRDSFIEPFKAGDFDGGLARAAEEIAAALPVGPPAADQPPKRRLGDAAPAGAQRPEPQFGVGSLFTIALGILAVLFVVRLLGGLFGGNRAGGYPQQMGMGGMGRPGMGGPGMGGPGMGGPGYGPGYGGRGGGFFSGLLGGLGGAMAGNWLYNQFSGHHSGGHSEASSYGHGQGSNDPYGAGGDSIIGADDDGGHGASWGDAGGGDWGDSGGGGDWGGGWGDDGGSW